MIPPNYRTKQISHSYYVEVAYICFLALYGGIGSLSVNPQQTTLFKGSTGTLTLLSNLSTPTKHFETLVRTHRPSPYCLVVFHILWKYKSIVKPTYIRPYSVTVFMVTSFTFLTTSSLIKKTESDYLGCTLGEGGGTVVLVINSLSGTALWYAERWSSRQGLDVTRDKG